MPKTGRNKIATRLGLGLNRAQRDSNKIRLEAYTERSEIATRLGLGLYRAQRDSNKIRLEAYTERSESNPGRSLGIIERLTNNCLEDSTSQAFNPQETYHYQD